MIAKNKIANYNKIDMPLLFIVVILLCFGLVMVLSASAPTALSETGNSYVFFKKQLFAAGIGIIGMIILTFWDYHKYMKHYIFIYLISFLILFTVKIPGLGVEAKGAVRWINLKFMTIQPSEISKIGLIIALSGYYMDKSKKQESFITHCLIPSIAAGLMMIVLYKVQNHLSAALIIGFVTLIMIFFSGISLRYIMYVGSFGLIVFLGIMAFLREKLGFRGDRIDAWKNLESKATTTAYQTLQSLYAIGSGNITGVGLGKSKQKYLYIPEAHNDFIFSIIAEELGFIGCLFVIILFISLIIRGVYIILTAKDKAGSLVTAGIISLISIQAIMNIAVVTNSMPNTGVALPFLSYGGTSLIILLSSIGIVLNVSKQKVK